MIRKFIISLTTAFACAGFVACNESYTEDVEETAGCAAVSSFSFAEDEEVLNNLDSVFFSIDLVKGEIFNADSLPYGTNVTKLVPVILTIDGASKIELTVKRDNKADTVYNYSNITDSIDFTKPVSLRVVSIDSKVERLYTVRVNVHKMKADSLSWSRAERTNLPSMFNYPNEQHTTKQGENLLCLTRYQQDYSLAIGNPSTNVWEKKNISFPFTPRLSSFTATEDALYILDQDGALYTSTDGAQWTSTGLNWHYVYGAYENSVIGSVETIDGWQIQQYPSKELTKLPKDMPISGMSMPLSYEFAMSSSAQLMFVGGRKVDGSLSNATWGFDGKNWAKISKRNLPEALEEMTVAPYYTTITHNNHTTTTYPTMIAMGGRKADGSVSSTVYISNDYGYTWEKASQLMQLPEYMPATRNAQAFVFSSTIDAKSRAIKPIESWECPYIYIFGGINASGSLQNTVWRGVINRLSFKPLQ